MPETTAPNCHACGDPNCAGAHIDVDKALNWLMDRVAELERQRDAVLALCDEAERGEPSAVFSDGGSVWGLWTEDIRKAYAP